jgi:hypothetical protein
VCFIFRCIELWLQCSVSFMHSLELLVALSSARETWTADAVRCARVSWEINFLLTFEIASFFYVYPVYSKFRTEVSKTLAGTVQNLVSRAIQEPGFLCIPFSVSHN